jgi:hypothetical protein
MTLAPGGQADLPASECAERDVRELLAETEAYREFYATVPIDALTRTL